jgi:hypothetical protein
MVIPEEKIKVSLGKEGNRCIKFDHPHHEWGRKEFWMIILFCQYITGTLHVFITVAFAW